MQPLFYRRDEARPKSLACGAEGREGARSGANEGIVNCGAEAGPEGESVVEAHIRDGLRRGGAGDGKDLDEG